MVGAVGALTEAAAHCAGLCDTAAVLACVRDSLRRLSCCCGPETEAGAAVGACVLRLLLLVLGPRGAPAGRWSFLDLLHLAPWGDLAPPAAAVLQLLAEAAGAEEAVIGRAERAADLGYCLRILHERYAHMLCTAYCAYK
jgi:hypothetical protein